MGFHLNQFRSKHLVLNAYSLDNNNGQQLVGSKEINIKHHLTILCKDSIIVSDETFLLRYISSIST